MNRNVPSGPTKKRESTIHFQPRPRRSVASLYVEILQYMPLPFRVEDFAR